MKRVLIKGNAIIMGFYIVRGDVNAICPLHIRKSLFTAIIYCKKKKKKKGNCFL